jgi:predicted small secreted protein
MKRLLLLTLTVLPLLASCNTIQGIGEDLQAGGKAISGAASDEKTPPPQNSSQQNQQNTPTATMQR